MPPTTTAEPVTTPATLAWLSELPADDLHHVALSDPSQAVRRAAEEVLASLLFWPAR